LRLLENQTGMIQDMPHNRRAELIAALADDTVQYLALRKHRRRKFLASTIECLILPLMAVASTGRGSHWRTGNLSGDFRNFGFVTCSVLSSRPWNPSELDETLGPARIPSWKRFGDVVTTKCRVDAVDAFSI
jgi:hypothetical protein